jgi:DMSO/TMAO reductase YedYZ molybdopterin-dependent catalytic subunit
MTIVAPDHTETAVPTPWWGPTLAGVVAAAIALAVGELVAALLGIKSLVLAVGDVIVENAPGWLASEAIGTLGDKNKPTLIVGIVVVCLVLGGVLGVIAQRRRVAGPLGFAAFAALGVWAQSSAEGGDVALGLMAAWIAAVAGTVALHVLLTQWNRPPTPSASRPGRGDPRRPTADRRAFLGWSGGMATAAAVLASGSRSLRSRSRAAEARDELAARLEAEGASTTLPTGLESTVDGLTPLVQPNDRFYKIDTTLFAPRVDPDGWSLRIDGMVDRPLEFTLDQLFSRELVERPVTLSCVSNEVGGDLVGNAIWQGIPLTELLDEAGVQEGATQVVGRSVDGWDCGFPTELVYDGREAMVALTMNGEPLPIDHGFPARLVVSGLYGYVSATKWLSSITLTTWEDFDGYWVPRGWSKEGPVKTQSRIDVPRQGRPIPAGSVPIAGVAWAPSRGIRQVEVQIDDGPWVAAELGDEMSDDTWRQWVLPWDATPGGHVIRCRATDETGTTQTDLRTPPDPNGASGWHTIRVSVA